jgi:hypothetical protein
LTSCQFIGILFALAMTTPLLAQSLRDPTLPPAAAAVSVPGDASKPVAVQSGSVAVMVRNGVPYLMVGTRLYSKGQKLGQARIERITETEVWLREDGTLRKMPVFGGIERLNHTPPVSVKQALRSASKSDRTKP